MSNKLPSNVTSYTEFLLPNLTNARLYPACSRYTYQISTTLPLIWIYYNSTNCKINFQQQDFSSNSSSSNTVIKPTLPSKSNLSNYKFSIIPPIRSYHTHTRARARIHTWCLRFRKPSSQFSMNFYGIVLAISASRDVQEFRETFDFRAPPPNNSPIFPTAAEYSKTRTNSRVVSMLAPSLRHTRHTPPTLACTGRFTLSDIVFRLAFGLTSERKVMKVCQSGASSFERPS